ncbi:hypothetical protein Bca4012_065665 [Brassica carinata]
MIVQQWCLKTTNIKPDLTFIPIWVDFKDVPDHLFTEIGLKCLGNIIGSFQKLHPNTQRCIRLDVARVLVVVNLEEPLPTIISLNSEEETLIQVSYPWLLPRCNTCSSWGHKESECAQMKIGSVVIQTQTKGSPSASSKEVLQPVEKEALRTETAALVESRQTENENIVEDTNYESVAQTKGSDTEIKGKYWTLVTGKASPRNSPGKKSEKFQQISLVDTANTEVSPSRFNLLSIDEEEENLEEGETSVAEDDKEEIREDDNFVASETDIQEKLLKLKPATLRRSVQDIRKIPRPKIPEIF